MLSCLIQFFGSVGKEIFMCNLNKFTPWAKEMYDQYDSRVCNTFILCGNIGDYAFGFYNLIDYLSKLFQSNDGFGFNSAIVYDTDNNGRYLFGGVSGKSMSFSEMCDKMEHTNADNKVAYIIRYPQSIIPDCPVSNMSTFTANSCIHLHRALTSVNFFRQKSMLIIIAESSSDVNKMFLSSNIKSSTIEIPLPGEEERQNFINLSVGYATKREKGFKSDISIPEFTRLTAGLKKMSIEDLILQGTNDNPLTKASILKKKERLIETEYSNIIELLDASNNTLDDFAGQEHIKEYFKDVVIDAIASDTRSIIPKGVLLMGPPGTGKSFFAKCLAGSAGINFVEFKMSKILDKYVGEAEKNLEKAFSVFRALAPVGVFIDELDQALSRGENDSNSVRSNLFGMFLAELSKSENRGKIIWLGATNYPNKIDEALKRTGRFDKKIPFFAPDEDGRVAVFKKIISKMGSVSGVIDYDYLKANTNNYTQAEIEGIVVKAFELAIRKKRQSITNDDLLFALDCIKSAQNDKIIEMENIALAECNDTEFLPKKYLDRKNNLFS